MPIIIFEMAYLRVMDKGSTWFGAETAQNIILIIYIERIDKLTFAFSSPKKAIAPVENEKGRHPNTLKMRHFLLKFYACA